LSFFEIYGGRCQVRTPRPRGLGGPLLLRLQTCALILSFWPVWWPRTYWMTVTGWWCGRTEAAKWWSPSWRKWKLRRLMRWDFDRGLGNPTRCYPEMSFFFVLL